MFKKRFYSLIVFAILGGSLACLSGCYKNMVPEEKDFFSADAAFSRTDFDVVLGRTNVFLHIYNPDYSTQPLEFTILNCRKADTVYLTTDSSHYRVDTIPAPSLRKEVSVSQWSSFYSGEEKSIEEIDAKRYETERPVLDIRSHSGDILFFRTNASVVEPGVYFFDVKVANGGGQRIYHMTLRVRWPHPYEPYNYDDITGKPLSVNNGGIIHPTNMNGVVDMLNRPLPADSLNIYFHKTGNDKNTLTIKFFDQDSLPISLSKFNLMEWDSLTYRTEMNDVAVPFGFNRKMNADSTAVTWDIPNPFPVLTDVSAVSVKANIDFRYNRVSFGRRVDANIGFSFNIAEPGQWEIIYKFRINPKFEDD